MNASDGWSAWRRGPQVICGQARVGCVATKCVGPGGETRKECKLVKLTLCPTQVKKGRLEHSLRTRDLWRKGPWARTWVEAGAVTV